MRRLVEGLIGAGVGGGMSEDTRRPNGWPRGGAVVAAAAKATGMTGQGRRLEGAGRRS